MLAFISSTIATLVSLLALAVIFPTVAGYPIRLVLRGLGCRIKKRTEAKRKLIRARVRVEEEDYQSQRNRQSKAEDADWEKVESYGSQTATDGKVKDSAWDGVVGFFHPFCNAGGGGERVLWAAVRATQKRWPKAICVIYTGDQDVDKATMLKNIERRFNIQLHPPTVVFCYLSTRKYVLSNTYPHFTLLGQSLGSLVLAYDAFTNLVPDVFVDTMGYAFALALSNFLFPSVPTGAYVHYPTISTDMLESLDDKTGQRGLNAGAGTEPKLILIGSVRQSSPDETHIYNLRLLAHELKIRDNTTFICDATWPTVLEHLRHASIGTNAMWNEHFGIGVVEYQAAGLISVVHDSGGPKMDIVIDLEEGATGFRATTEVEYAAAFEAALALPDEEKVAMRMRARKSAQRFTEEEFEKKWLGDMEKLVDLRVQRAGR
ncbi:alpha-1,2-mannosyltransferase ALG11 [Coccidioides immitis H538.4]|uniref:GDP-Man:Man(3)GlcNAc(2)-PP-Dol alpha-1,2-mannosyltransferase n=1 Tax=Coccidioides immitis H538.4 TaxID=396776 RepID=A0A0J8RVK9_COCIT|nr:alpha-1,2-mannosyltransferase ALG11 [Coccidioides immitis H538.4]